MILPRYGMAPQRKIRQGWDRSKKAPSSPWQMTRCILQHLSSTPATLALRPRLMRNHQLAPVLLRLPPRRLYHQPVQIHPRGQTRHLDPHNPPRNDTCPPRPGFGYGALTRNASGNALTTSCAVNAPRSNVIRYDLPHTSARPSTHR